MNKMKKYVILYTATAEEVVHADQLAEADLTVEQYAEYVWNDQEMALDVKVEIREVNDETMD